MLGFCILAAALQPRPRLRLTKFKYSFIFLFQMKSSVSIHIHIQKPQEGNLPRMIHCAKDVPYKRALYGRGIKMSYSVEKVL